MAAILIAFVVFTRSINVLCGAVYTRGLRLLAFAGRVRELAELCAQVQVSSFPLSVILQEMRSA